jgi:hypothetical protein
MSLSRSEIEGFREPLEALGYEPAVEGDEEATANHAFRYFDKETGTFTDQGAPGETFVKDEDVIRGPATTNAAPIGPAPEITPAIPPVQPTPGLLGGLPEIEPPAPADQPQ